MTAGSALQRVPGGAFGLAVVVYSVAALGMLAFHQYPLLDTLSYISVASKYAAGDLHNAVNGYWGVLTCWLLVPFLKAGVDPELALRLMTAFFGLVTLVGARRLSAHFEMDPGVRDALLIALVPLVLSFSYMPDLLLTCGLVYYFGVVFDPEYPRHRWSGALAGVFGGLAYLGKHYACPLFLAHFTISTVLHSWKGAPGGRLIRHFALGLLVFAIPVGGWGAALSAKYGKPTIGTSGSYNLAVVGPAYESHPTYYKGLYPPPDPMALAAWDDPTFIEVEGWSPFASTADFMHLVRLVGGNGLDLIGLYAKQVPLWLAILVGFAIMLVPWRRRDAKLSVSLPLVTVLLCPSGYFLMHVCPEIGRFTWICCVLFLLMAGSCVTWLFRSEFFDRRRRLLLLALVIATFLPKPLQHLQWRFRLLRDVVAVGDQLTASVPLQGKVAANKRLHHTWYLSYRLGCKFYGTRGRYAADDEIRAQLDEHGVDYYVVWRGRTDFDPLPPFLADRPEVTGGRFHLLRIYALKDTD